MDIPAVTAQYSADNESSEVQDQARHLLGRVPMLQNQHIMGAEVLLFRH